MCLRIPGKNGTFKSVEDNKSSSFSRNLQWGKPKLGVGRFPLESKFPRFLTKRQACSSACEVNLKNVPTCLDACLRGCINYQYVLYLSLAESSSLPFLFKGP